MKVVPISSPAAVTSANSLPAADKTIKMNVNQTPLSAESILQSAPPAPEGPVSTSNAETTETKEATKPLSPQFAALAKQRRELQVREAQLAEREKALTSQPASEDLIAKLKTQPLSVLQEHGITYEQLTEAILAGNSGVNPEIQALKAEIKALKEGVDKTFTDRDTAQETQVLAEMRKEAAQLAQDEKYELIREQGKVDDVVELIKRVYKEENEILDVEEAMKLVHAETLKDIQKLVNLKTVRGLIPSDPIPQPQQRQPQMRTLTNRDTATQPMSRKARALAAALGHLRK